MAQTLRWQKRGSLVTSDRGPSSCGTVCKFSDLTDTHHHLRVHTTRMRGVRIVEHDDNKGCKTTFQFTTPLEKSAQEAGSTEV